MGVRSSSSGPAYVAATAARSPYRWEAALSEDLLGKWALNLMLINVSTRKFGRAVRLPEGDVPAPNGAGVSKSAVSRRFVALSAERMKQWMAADLSNLDAADHRRLTASTSMRT